MTVFADYVEYNPESPSGLSWVVNRFSGKHLKKLECAKGSYCLNKDNKGYWRVSIQAKSFLSSRIIWELVYGYTPTKFIDHIDGNSCNNLIENLREADFKVNGRNRKMSTNNSSGFTGVSLRSGKWIGTFQNDAGEQQSKSFTVSKYGNEAAFTLAKKFRDDGIAFLNSLGAGYTETHGVR